MTEKEAIARHLSQKPPRDGIKEFSGFAGALTDARTATGRIERDGTKVEGHKHGSWLGALGYMALLNQIGNCFRPKSHPPVAGSSIFRALTYFSSLPGDEIGALYALRCAFAHDYSLCNVNTRKPSLMHRFQVTVGEPLTTVILPKTPWDGDMANKTSENVTTVNLEAFGDLVEDICRQLFAMARADEVDVVLAGGSDELLQRYAFVTRATDGGR